MSQIPAPALKALLERLIDYAGMFPPAALPLDTTLANYDEYQHDKHAWMLRWLVVNAKDVDQVPTSLTGQLAVLTNQDDSRAACLETKAIVNAARPVYCEVSTNKTDDLDEVQQAGCFAKIRTGGITPEAIPSPKDVAGFITACAQKRLAFKATAGLHHPLRSVYPLTYDANAPRGTMHGFLNVLMASAFAWHGESDIEPILAETDPSAFSFNDRAHWREKSLSIEQVAEARKNFMHSIGSCSFEEPVQELQAMGLL